MDTKKVWLVTGASKGLGLSLIKKLLSEGYNVAATSRSVDGLKKGIGSSSHFLPLQVEITDEQSVQVAVQKAIKTFGKIDVVVNNAGYGQLGTIEELTDEEARKNFNVNVFGALNVIRSVMPHLRQQKSGHIINIASIAGFMGAYAGVGIYCATKFAVAGFTEALAAEVKEFGISATVVYPGVFRTNFLEPGSVGLPEHPIADYTEGRRIVALHIDELNGNQQGDPEKAAVALLQLGEMEQPPVHLFLGSDALNLAQTKIDIIQKDLNDYQALTQSTDF